MRTLVIAGAGPLVGYSIAKRFGREGFHVALIARRREALDSMVARLKGDGVEAAAFPADLTNSEELKHAFEEINRRFGSVDVLEFSPTDWGKSSDKDKNNHATALTPDIVLNDFKLLVLGAVSCVKHVLPEMLARGEGALLFTTGYSAIKPLSFIASLGVANAGLRNYAYCLHEDLAPKNVYVGTVSINALIERGTEADPDKVADLYFDMYRARDRVEAVFGKADH